jgi:hypothetical protein
MRQETEAFHRFSLSFVSDSELKIDGPAVASGGGIG